MMRELLKRGAELASTAQARRIEGIADRLTELLRGSSITIEESRILVSGRGLLERWLIDPQLRFLAGDRR